MSTDYHSFILPLGRRDDQTPPHVDAWYDTRESLDARLKSGLDGLREIAQARSQAGYERKERMAEWCLLGSFYADTCGNFSPITQGSPADAYEFMDYNGALPRVLSREEMGRYTQRWTASMTGRCIPPVDARCDRCGHGWSIENVRDFYSSSEKPPRHRSCHQFAVIEKEIKEISEIVRRAEIPFSDFYMIPNEYYPGDPDYFGPWFMVETPQGRLKIGWRKRVINIDWSGTGLNPSPETFASEDVTKGMSYIHAWGTDKAVEYLRKLWGFQVP
jgi:hypothetical protein